MRYRAIAPADPRTPRTKDGKPDLTGVWQGERPPQKELAATLPPDLLQLQVDLPDLTRNAIDIVWGSKPEEEPLTPTGAAVVKQRATENPPTLVVDTIGFNDQAWLDGLGHPRSESMQ